jgi:hypothetical protein
MPGVAVLAAAVVVVDAMLETASPPLASSAAASGAAVLVQPGSCSAPTTPPSFGAWGPAPLRRTRRCGGASVTWPPRGPGCSGWWPIPAPHHPSKSGWSPRCACGRASAPAPSFSLFRWVPDLRGRTRRGLGRGAASYRARCRGSSSRDWGRLHLPDCQAALVESWHRR